MEYFSFPPPLNLFEEGKKFLAVTNFEATNSFINVTDENNSFSITIPRHCYSELAEKTFDELSKLSELRSQNDIELPVEQGRKKSIFSKNDYSLFILDTSKNEKL